MASVIRYTRAGETCYRVQFFDNNGKRRAIRLGKTTKRIAENFGREVEAIANSKGGGSSLEQASLDWLTSIKVDWHKKSVDAGLVKSRN